MEARRLFLLPSLALAALVLFTSCNQSEQDQEAIEVSGLIEAIKTEVRAQAQGEIKEIFVQEGQVVNQGDPLCFIDDEKLQIQINQVQAALEGARSKLKLFEKGTKKELIAVAQNQREAAEKELELAQKNQKRMIRLLEEGAVSEAQKEKADLRLKAARENFQSADENYRLALRGKEKEEIDMVKAEIKKLQSQKKYLLREIQDTKVLSPVSGYLETRHVEVGELAISGILLFSLIDFEKTYVKAYVPEKYIGKVTLGSAVEVTCDSFPHEIFQGEVDYVSSQAEFAPKNIQTKEERLKLVFMIKSYLKNDKLYLKPGMPVDVTIDLNE